jgi:hypothetical protein
LPALYLAVERGSQFTTADEKRILRETLQWSAGCEIKEWNLGANRTSTLFMAPAACIVRVWPSEWPLERRLALLKNIHWALGFILFLALVVLAHRAFDLAHQPVSWLLFVYVLLLLPVHLMALKIVNYDKLSLDFSMISLLLVILAAHKNHLLPAHAAVVAGYLGAQEKLSASPFLLLAMIALAYLVLRRVRVSWRAGYAILAPLGLCAFVGGLTTFGAIATRSFDTRGFRYLGFDIVDPLVSWVWLLHRALIGGSNFVDYRWVHLGVVVATFLACTCGLLLLRPLTRTVNASINDAKRAAALLTLLAIVLAAGLWGTFAVVGFWHPHHPIEKDQFHPGGELNRVVLHFAAHTHAQHVARAVGFHYAVFLNALPTVVLGTGVLLLLSRLQRRKWPAPWSTDLLLATALLVPLAWAALNMPFGHRYLNFALLLLTLAVLVALLKSVATWKRWQRLTVAGSIALATLLEVLPFAPAYFAFRPIWSPHAYPDAQVPIPGRLNPTWLGWGEETMLCANMLQRQIADGRIEISGQPVVLYVAYFCDWLNPSPRLDVRPLAEHMAELQYSPTEYYLLNRSAVVQRMWAFPDNTTPEFVLSYRGYVQAWVFRGDKLRAAGFAF